MKKVLTLLESKLFRQFLKRYLFAFVLPVTSLMLLLFYFNTQTVKNGVYSSQQAAATQQQITLDNEADSIRRSARN